MGCFPGSNSLSGEISSFIHSGPVPKQKGISSARWSSGGFHFFDVQIAHFGLEEYKVISKIEVHWSTGEMTTVTHPFLRQETLE